MSSTLLGWIVTIGFVVILAVGFLIGMWRGLKRSTVNLVISVIGVIIAFFITPVITNAILGIKVMVDGSNSTLQQVIVELFKKDKDINAMMMANKNLEVFFMNLPSALVNVVVFIVITMIVELLFYIVYKIIAVTALRIKEDEKKRSVLGGAVGLVKTFIVVLFAFMPLAGLTGVANNLLVSDNYGIVAESEKKTSFTEDKLPKNAKNIIVGLENNMLIKMCGMFGLDNAMFDYYSTFEVDGENLTVREEVDNLYRIVDVTYQVSTTDLSKVNFVKVRYDKVLKALKDTTNSTLFKKVVADTLADMIINNEKYSFIENLSIYKDYPEVMDNIKAHLGEFVENGKAYQYFQNDLLEVVNAVKVLGQSGIINEIIDLKDASIEDVASVLTSSENEIALKNSIDRILEVNIVRDGISTIVQKGLDEVSSKLDKIDVSTTDWTEENWDEFTNSVYNIVNNFGDIVNEIDLFKVLEDATILLDENADYDITLITSKLGAFVDEVRNNKLLKNSEGKSIIDEILKDSDITLPENQVKDHNGDYYLQIDNYTEYFNFISSSLLKLRDKGIYEIIDDSSLSANNKITSIAEILSAEGNAGLLKDIILPLYQIEPTKTMIIDELSSALQSDLVDFASLTTYEDWEKDLGYISDMLIVLNSLNDGTNSYLSLALEGNTDLILESFNEKDVESVLKPILYAKSTSGIREELFASIKTQLDDASGSDSTISLANATFIEGNEEDQTSEVVEIVKKLIAVDNALDEGKTLRLMDKLTLGSLLNTMRDNAYRVEISEKEEQGIFKNAFVDLVEKFKEEYYNEIEYIESQPEILEELKVSNLGEDNYKNINYIQLLNKIAELEALN